MWCNKCVYNNINRILNVEADLLHFTKRVTKTGGSEIRGNDMHWTVSPLKWKTIGTLQ